MSRCARTRTQRRHSPLSARPQVVNDCSVRIVEVCAQRAEMKRLQLALQARSGVRTSHPRVHDDDGDDDADMDNSSGAGSPIALSGGRKRSRTTGEAMHGAAKRSRTVEASDWAVSALEKILGHPSIDELESVGSATSGVVGSSGAAVLADLRRYEKAWGEGARSVGWCTQRFAARRV